MTKFAEDISATPAKAHSHKTKQNLVIKFLLIALGLFFMLDLFLDLFTLNFKSLSGEDYPTVLNRVLLHFFPLCPLLIILFNAPLKKT